MPIVHPCSLLLENKAFLLQKEKQNMEALYEKNGYGKKEI